MPSPSNGAKPAGNQPGGQSAPWHDYKNGDRARRSGKNLSDNRAVGAPEVPVNPEAVGQLPDPEANQA